MAEGSQEHAPSASEAPVQASEAPVPEEAPATLEEAHAWLERIKPAAILTLLKDPDYALTVSRAFFGFRPDAKSYANTLVRSRLAQAAIKDSQFAGKLKTFAEVAAPMLLPEPKTVPLSVSSAVPIRDRTEMLRAERDQRRRERDEARQALSLLQSEQENAVKACRKAEEERDEAIRQAKKQSERIARLERQTLKQQDIEAGLIRALNQDKVSPPPTVSARASGPAPIVADEKISPWLTAIYHWLDKGKFEQALALAGEVLKSEPEEETALEVAARSWEGRRERTQAAPFLRRLLTAQISRQAMTEAADTVWRLLRLAEKQATAEGDARSYLTSLPAGDPTAVEAGRRLLARLRGSDPQVHGWLAAMIAEHTPLAPVLMPPPGALGPDDPLPFRLSPGEIVTANRLAEAVDSGETALVESARKVLTMLEKTDPETHNRVWAALNQAAGDDLSRFFHCVGRRAGRLS